MFRYFKGWSLISLLLLLLLGITKTDADQACAGVTCQGNRQYYSDAEYRDRASFATGMHERKPVLWTTCHMPLAEWR